MSLFQTVVTVVLGVVLAIVAVFASVSPAPTPAQNAPANPGTQQQNVASTSSPIGAVPEPAATSTPPKKAPAPKKLTSPLPKTAPVPAPTPTQNILDTVTQSSQATTTATTTPLSLNDRVRGAVVNIVCTTQAGGPLNSISASGVVIDSRGVILTNSHVAQYFLLKDYPTHDFVSCIIRTGSPATPSYIAKLLFMPPSWMAQNAYKINSAEPTGNGEHDYALLLITGPVGPGTTMPSSFPFLPISVDPPAANQSTFLAAYPAGFLGGITVAQNLYQSSAYATVGDLYTFESNTLDLFSVGGTILSQHGSSGGAVTDTSGNLIGLIVTATDAPDTASRDLRAISTPYLITDFAKEAGISLSAFLAGDVSLEAQSFAVGIAPTLRAELVQALAGQ